ncbi:hypothetical protein FACS1894204_09140 [Synergistales bacterium]|nr:hypothetical protein FACS1894204_09140 [Synergistales bacterium]
MKITFEPLAMKHADIALRLRKSDIREIENTARVLCEPITPQHAVIYSINNTPNGYGYAAFNHGDLVAVFGVSLRYAKWGNIWLLGTDEINKHPLVFYRESKRMLIKLSEEFDCLSNFVGFKNFLTLKWLLWLGFEITKAEPPFNEYFYNVSWTRPCAP